MNYWVMNVYRDKITAHGSYKSREAAENRMRRIQGGETSVFHALTDDPKRAIQEFRDHRVKELLG